MIIAGHCGLDGDSTNMGAFDVNPAVYPNWDVAEVVGGNGYVGGLWDSATTTRPVTNAANPAVGMDYCTTGRATQFRCNWRLESTGVTICYTQGYPPGACAHNLVGFHRFNLPYAIEPGDSGGPLWYKYANGGAGIRGVISGYFFDLFVEPGIFMSYATPYQVIANKLSISAVLLPAPPP